MRQSSFDNSRDDQTALPGGVIVDPGRRTRGDRVGAWLVAIAAFATYYQNVNSPAGVNLDSAWFDVLVRGFASGWQWGSDIIFTYGPLGFLTPYITWNPEIGSTFRIGQIVLCGLWAAMMFAFARGLGPIRQGMLILAFLAWYPLLVMDIGWNVPFIVAIVLIHRLAGESARGQPRRATIFVIIALLSLLALVKFTGQIMWIGVVGYATVVGLLRRDLRLALLFGVGAPLFLLALWLGVGQHLGGFADYLTSSLEMSLGYGAMSLQPGPRVDAMGALVLLLLAGVLLSGICLSPARRHAMLTAFGLAVLSFLAWKAGYVRPDGHIAIFHGTACFIAVAALCTVTLAKGWLVPFRWLCASVLFVVCLSAAYGMTDFEWSLRRIPVSMSGLLQPDRINRDSQARWDEQVTRFRLPRTRARVGDSRVDVLMNEQSIALLNQLNYQPRPAFQGYAAYTPSLTRLNEGRLLSSTEAPDFLLTKLQSIDFRLPTGEDPLSVLSALRAYLPVDMEGGYLVMQRTGWPISPIQAPAAENWKMATLGADIVFGDSPKPQLLFFDIQLNFWGKLRSLLIREPNLRVELRLNDGTEQSYQLVRKLGTAGMLISPFMLSEMDYLRWHASLAERRVASMRLRASDLGEVRWFEPQFTFALAPVELPRRAMADLSPELQSVLYPGFTPAPIRVESGREEIVKEGGTDVLFTHAPATLTFAPGPGEWKAGGNFGLLSSAYACEASDGIALIADRVDAAGTATRLYARAIHPVQNPAERGSQAFAFGPFTLHPGDTLVLRNSPGLVDGAKGDCDWMFLGPMHVDKVLREGSAN